jgi:predicted porin
MTWYVRRAFVYMGSDQVGIVRVGMADGLQSLYDGGRTTFQFVTPSGGLNGSDLNGLIGGNSAPVFAFSTVSGNEYDTQKIVYLSPSFAGFDFGLQYSPSAFNGFTSCAVPATACANLISSGTAADGSRYRDMFNVGLRYNGSFGPLAVLAYGVYGTAGHVTTNTVAPAPGTRFDNLNYWNAGVALTFAGFSVGGNFITGDVNGQLAARPTGGADMNGWLVGAAYQAGPLTVGGSFEMIDSQGAATLAGFSQRKEYAFDVGVSYALAPGLTVYADCIYQNRKQSGFNFASGTVGTAYNQVQGQGFLVGTTVVW